MTERCEKASNSTMENLKQTAKNRNCSPHQMYPGIHNACIKNDLSITDQQYAARKSKNGVLPNDGAISLYVPISMHDSW